MEEEGRWVCGRRGVGGGLFPPVEEEGVRRAAPTCRAIEEKSKDQKVEEEERAPGALCTSVYDEW